jgi:hypothetical protein
MCSGTSLRDTDEQSKVEKYLDGSRAAEEESMSKFGELIDLDTITPINVGLTSASKKR